ncbi:hypothetical protein AVEN_72126-1 [Araneus ventricosus]|uniref:Uncharacterized protein n=1 Tax=Araneus ventricosus TaxID=182803 RepID=A0A4Y2NKD4_ARAVE|nr:hypothetical protein AVEN_72126-1 [Araneus ventricosus]
MEDGGGQKTLDDITRHVSYEIKLPKSVGWFAARNCLKFSLHRECVWWRNCFDFENGMVGPEDLDDISRRHKLSYEIKLPKLSVVAASELVLFFLHRECVWWRNATDFFQKMGDGGGQKTLDDISRRHKLSNEIKNCRSVVAASELSQVFLHRECGGEMLPLIFSEMRMVNRRPLMRLLSRRHKFYMK